MPSQVYEGTLGAFVNVYVVVLLISIPQYIYSIKPVHQQHALPAGVKACPAN